jgi:hypothetical protein
MQMGNRLERALDKLARMSHPSVAGLLSKYSFDYEAEVVDEVVAAFEEWQKAAKCPGRAKEMECGSSSSESLSSG